MDEAERKKLSEELEVKKKEFVTLKSALNELNILKEDWFDKKRKASQAISAIIGDMRDAKGKRNTFTKQVKDSKHRRDELNDVLKQKKSEMQKLQEEKRQITSKLGITADPSKIQREIEQLEFKIETEGLPFNVEQKIMKMIGEKKKFLNQAKDVSDVFDRIHKLGKEMDKIRQKADEAHKKIQDKAESSQQFHEELVGSSNEVKELRDNEEEALKKFVEFKTKYNEQNALVNAKIKEMSEIRAKLEGVNLEERQQARKNDDAKLSEQKASVEEKIKKGMKLTTEDLLAFQAESQSSQVSIKSKRRRD